MKITIFGLSITSSWGNGHATTFRALCHALHRRGHRIVFFERNQEWYQNNRDLPCPPYCGVRRVMSVIRPDTVGSVARSSRVTAVAAPVRLVLNTGSIVAVTVTTSATAATFNLNARSVDTPRLTETPSLISVLKPASAALTLYGPPTRTPGSVKRPSP